MNKLFEEMEEEQSSNIENLEQNDLTTVASLAKKQKNQEQKVKDLDAELKEAKKELLNNSVKEVNITTLRVPGAFELPLGAKSVSRKDDVDAIICLGVVIKGDTPHFDVVINESSKGIAAVSRETGVPIIFGVLCTENLEQALIRSESKGRDMLDAAIQTLIEYRKVDKH